MTQDTVHAQGRSTYDIYIEIDYKVLPSTINRKRTSKFIKSNSNTFKSHNKVG